MPFVVKNNLNSFSDKLKHYNIRGGLADKITNKVADKGAEIAKKNWDAGVKVVVRGRGNKKSIVAKDTNSKDPTLAYREFGTGIQGEGKYEGTLPTQSIEFTDKSGVQWTTQGWEYHYRYNQTGRGKPFNGQAPQMPMFNTAKELREYIKTSLAKDIKKGD